MKLAFYVRLAILAIVFAVAGSHVVAADTPVTPREGWYKNLIDLEGLQRIRDHPDARRRRPSSIPGRLACTTRATSPAPSAFRTPSSTRRSTCCRRTRTSCSSSIAAASNARSATSRPSGPRSWATPTSRCSPKAIRRGRRPAV